MVNMKKIWIFFFTIFAISQAVCGPMTWSTPEQLSGVAVDASDPQMVVDENGNATAAWVEGGVVKTSSHPVGGSWGSVTTLSGSGASSPHLTIDAAGNVNALWLENGVVKSRTLLFGLAWGLTNSVSDSGASEPMMDIDPATGHLVAVWTRSGFIESATKLFGLLWGQVSVLSIANSDTPSVAVNDGVAVAVWHTVVSQNDTIVAAATASVGGAWNSAKTISPVTLNHVLPSVAVGVNGNAQAVWYQYNLVGLNYTNVTLMGSTLFAGSSNWTTAIAISAPGNHDPADLKARVAFDDNGNAIAFWSNVYESNLFSIESAILPLGGSWGEPGPLVNFNLNAYHGDVAVNAFGDAVVAYMLNDSGTAVGIQSSESNIAGVTTSFWSIPITISQGTENGFPRIGSKLTGTTINATAIWLNYDGFNNTVQASIGSRTILLPPANLAVVQNVHSHGIFDEYYNTLSWDASPDLDTVSYRIYRNGVFYAEVDSSTLELIDNNQDQNGPVTYGVAATDSDNLQSQIIMVSFP